MSKFQCFGIRRAPKINFVLIPIIIFLVFQVIVPNSMNAYAQSFDCDSSLVTRVDASYQGPVVLDTYLTDASAATGTVENPKKVEIGPSEGPTTLAVVLVNRSQQDLYAITGYLKLPKGFSAGGTSATPEARAMFSPVKGAGFNDPAIASYFSTISPGQTFTLYFDINVLDDVKVGNYYASLIVKYYTVNNLRGCNSALLDAPFVLPGKVILDIVSNNQKLDPKAENKVEFSIVNKGSAPATGVVATITNLGDNTGKGSGAAGGSLVLQSASTELVNLGSSAFNIGTIPANGKTTISTIIFPSSASGGTVQNVDIQLDFGNAYGYRNSQTLSTGLVISPTPTDTSLIITAADNKTPLLITAGTSQDVELNVQNAGKTPLTDIVLTLSTSSDSLKIVGKTKWVIPELEPGSSQQIKSQVFAATSLINSPESFTVTQDYIIEGERKTETTDIGGFIAGDIKLKLYDVSVNQQGNQFNIVGSILNEGSTTGKFSSIELISFNPKYAPQKSTNQETGDTPIQPSSAEKSPELKKITSVPQYLGDIPNDSTIPFSIPIPSNQFIPGVYPATFKIVYADDLKNVQEVTIDGQVTYEPQQNNLGTSGRANQRVNSDILIYIYPIIATAAIGTAVIVIRKIKKSKPKNGLKDDDISSLLDNATTSSSG